MLNAVSTMLYRYCRWPAIVLALVLQSVFMSQVMAPQGADMITLTDAWSSPDGHFFYTPDELYSHLAVWTEAGKALYISFRLGLDPVWALVYGGVLIITTSVALRHVYPQNHPRRLWNLCALLPMTADITENFIGIILVHNLPERLDWLAWMGASITAFKWVTLGFAHVIALAAVVAALIALARRRSAA